MRETNELQHKNGQMKLELDKAAFQLKEANDKLSRLEWKVTMLTSTIEVWLIVICVNRDACIYSEMHTTCHA